MLHINYRNGIHILLGFILLILISCGESIYDKTQKNYGEQVEQFADTFDLPSEYLKALIILECSGKKKIPPRFEINVYKQLKKLKAGTRKDYGSLTQQDLQNASDEDIKNLARSWGPFQLMGYKCLELGIKVKDIRGDSAVYWGIYWINKSYGDHLRQKKYKEAFRIHNTGKPNGKTHDPDYVKNGLKHIEYFTSQN